MVVFDATMLMLMLRPNSGRPLDSSGNPIANVPERIAHLVQHLERAKIRIVVPTPALSEVLVHAGNSGPEIVETLTRSAAFKVVPFDSLAAIEAALMTREAISAGDKRGGLGAIWAKIKFDRQIVAIAKVTKATMIYSDDHDVRTIAEAENIVVTGLADLPLPPEKRQQELELVPPAKEPTDAEPEEGDEAPDEEGDAEEPV